MTSELVIYRIMAIVVCNLITESSNPRIPSQIFTKTHELYTLQPARAHLV